MNDEFNIRIVLKGFADGLLKALTGVNEAAENTGKALKKAFKDVDKDQDAVAKAAKRTAEGFDEATKSMVKANQAAQSLEGGLGMAKIALLALFGQGILSGLIALGAQLVSLASSATLAAGALGGALAAGIGALIPVIGVAIGAFQSLKGVFSALKLEGQAAAKSGADAAKSADQHRKAVQGLADAQYNLKQAQKGVIDARREAGRDLEDLITKEKELQISLERNARSLTERYAAASAAKTTFAGGGFDLAGAQLDLKDQQLTNATASRDAVRTQEDLARALQKGVEHSDRMEAAQRQLLLATRAVADAQRALKDEMKGTGGAADQLAQALAKLTPAQRQLYNSLLTFKKDLKAIFTPIGDEIAVALAGAVDRIDGVFKNPKITQGLKGIGSELGKSITYLSKSLSSPEVVGNFTKLFAVSQKALPIVTKILDNLGRTLLNIAVAGGPTLLKILNGAQSLTKKWADNTRDIGRLEAFFAKGFEHLKAWYNLFAAIGRLFVSVINPSADAGKKSVEGMTEAINSLTDFVNKNPEKVKKFFDEAGDAVRTLANILVDLTVQLAKLYDAESFELMVKALGNLIPPLITVLGAFGQLGKIISMILAMPVVGDLAGWIIVITGTGLALTKMGFIIKGVFTAIKVGLEGLTKTNAILLALSVIALLIYENWDKIKPVLIKIWEWIDRNLIPVFKDVGQWAIKVSKWIVDGFKTVLDAIMRVVDWVKKHWEIALYLNPVTAAIKLIKDHWNDLVGFFKTVGGTIKNIFEDAWNVVSRLGTGAGNAIKGAFDGVVGVATSAVKGVYDVIKVMWNGVADLWEPIKDQINNVSPLGDLPSIPKMPEWGGGSGSSTQGSYSQSELAGGASAAADGAWVPARSGGSRYIVGEGGYDEVILSTDPRKRQRTAGLMGKFMQHFARGGVVTSNAFAAAKAFMDRHYGDSYSQSPGKRTGPNSWDCSGAAGYIANMFPGYKMGVGGTTYSYWDELKSRNYGSPKSPVVFGFAHFGADGKPGPGHMFITVDGKTFNAHSAKSSPNIDGRVSPGAVYRVPIGLENIGSGATTTSSSGGGGGGGGGSSSGGRKRNFAEYFFAMTGRGLNYSPLKYLQKYYRPLWQADAGTTSGSSGGNSGRTVGSPSASNGNAGETAPRNVVAIAAKYPVRHPQYGGTPRANIISSFDLAKGRGWTGDQFDAMVELWWRESGWSQLANASGRHGNPDTKAYGIPQALPPTKMASAGSDWASNAKTQIKWGLGYIGGRYGNPVKALAHKNATKGEYGNRDGWYASGGMIPGEGQPVPIVAHGGEMILNRHQQDALGGRGYLMNRLGLSVGGTAFANGGVVAGLGGGFGSNFDAITSLGIKNLRTAAVDLGRVKPGQFSTAGGFIRAFTAIEKVLTTLNESVSSRVEGIATLVANRVKRFAYILTGKGQVLKREGAEVASIQMELDGLNSQLSLLVGQEGILRTALANAQKVLARAKTRGQKEIARQTVEKIGAELNAVLGQQGDIMAEIFAKQGEAIQAELNTKLKDFDVRDQNLEILRSRNALTGGSSQDLSRAGYENSRQKYGIIAAAAQTARNAGQNDLADELESQMRQLEVTINQQALDYVQQGIDDVSNARQKADRKNDLQERVAKFFGRDLNGVAASRIDAMFEQVRGLSAQLQNANAVGATSLAEEISQQIEELNQDIRERQRQIFTDAQEAASKAFDTAMSFNDVAFQIAGLTGPGFSANIPQQMELLRQRGQILTGRGSTLANQLNQALADGLPKEDIDNLRLAIEQNKLAVLQNSQQLAELNGSMGEAQGFESATWRNFRQAIFDGSGGLLSQYAAIPKMASGGMITKEGLFYLHAGEKVTPADQVDGSTNIVVNLTNPTEVADPQFIAKRIAFEMRGRGR